MREMVARADAATPEDICAAARARPSLLRARRRRHAEPPGEQQAEVDGVTYRLGDKVVLRLERPLATPTTSILNGRIATLERIYFDYDDKLYFGVTVDDDPGQELMRETGRFLFFFTGELEVCRDMTQRTEKQILVAGIGNAWLRDDGFGGEVVQRLEARELPAGVSVVDFGTGGLDLAYEVMRGYDALVLVDVSRQGGEPGHALRDGARRGRHRGGHRGRRDDRPARDGPADRAALRARRRRLAGQGRRHRLRAGRGRGDGPRPQRPGQRGGRRRRRRSSSTIATLRAEVAPRPSERRARALPRQRRHRHRRAPRRRPARDRGVPEGRPPAPGRARVARVLLRARRARHGVRGRAPGAGGRPGAPALRLRPRVGARRHRLPLLGLRRRRREVVSGEEFLVESIDVEDRSRHAPREGQGRRGRAGRQQHDRPRQPRRLRRPRRHRRQPHELAGGRQDHAAGGAARRRDRRRPRRRARGRRAGLDGRRPARQPARPGHPAQHRPGLRRRMPPRRQHGALGAPRAAAATTSTC